MIEIIATVWVTSFVLSIIIVALNFAATNRQLHSPRLATLNGNLAKVNLFWSNSQGDFAELSSEAIAEDAWRTKRNAILIGCLGVASLLGLILILIIVLSLRFLARSRREVATFRSPLANDSALSPETIQALIAEMRLIH